MKIISNYTEITTIVFVFNQLNTENPDIIHILQHPQYISNILLKKTQLTTTPNSLLQIWDMISTFTQNKPIKRSVAKWRSD